MRIARRSPIAALLLISLATCPAVAETEKLNIIGFFDLEADFRDTDTGIWTFDQHHFNLLMSFNIHPRWRALADIEYEHGPKMEGSGGTGEIALEEGWVEFRPNAAFRLRGGKILAPFGLYNAVHDRTWLFHFTFLPESVYGTHRPVPSFPEQQLHSKFATGLEAIITRDNPSSTFEIRAYLSNGRGAAPAESDDNANKGVGWRITLADDRGRWQLGHSFYTDRNGEAAHSKQYHFGLDLTLSSRTDHAGWVLNAEGNWSRIVPEDPGIETAHYLGGYGELLYRARSGWTPWVRLEYSDENRDLSGDSLSTYGAGIAYDVNDFVRVKSSCRFSPQTDARHYAASMAVRF